MLELGKASGPCWMEGISWGDGWDKFVREVAYLPALVAVREDWVPSIRQHQGPSTVKCGPPYGFRQLLQHPYTLISTHNYSHLHILTSHYHQGYVVFKIIVTCTVWRQLLKRQQLIT